MIKKIDMDFQSMEKHRIEVESKNHTDDENISFLDLIAGECLMNSKKVAAKKLNVLIAEGFLLTYHKNKDIQCVGHAWNIVNEKHVDYTLSIKMFEEIEKIEYFFFQSYPITEVNIVEKPNPSYPGITAFTMPFKKFLEFKTDVQSKAREYRLFLQKNN